MVCKEEKADRFWLWFSENQDRLKGNKISDSLVSQLEEELFSYGRLDWEIGPDLDGKRFFALSPSKDPDLTEKAKILLSRSPQIQGWVFYSHKPPKKWNLTISTIVDGEEVEVDGKLWTFVAFRFPDGVFELDFCPPTDLKLPLHVLENLAITFLDGEIGEERRLKLVEKVSVVTMWSEDLQPKSRSLEIGLLSRVLV